MPAKNKQLQIEAKGQVGKHIDDFRQELTALFPQVFSPGAPDGFYLAGVTGDAQGEQSLRKLGATIIEIEPSGAVKIV